ncbi:UDP-2,3-diacylglucosamine diphosphatase [Basfia succiniciproducens]|uniref:UDP-2,3-diacylglucosamine diphosphatase n=1 Tax=Basfia succiniciproducens TaxID=653940 RepID=UPI003FCCEF6F
MKKTYFISDLHLSENRPKLTALFEHFMHNIAPQAQAVYILGDLFDFWVGDDEKSPLISRVQAQIKQLTEKNIPCYFIHGNRDFLLGEKFAESCGLQLLPDYKIVNLYGTDTLICHGDTLCTDDVNYQTFRRKVHQKWRQRLFLLLPLKVRIKIADKIRRQSRHDKKMKSAEIMDVNGEFVCQIFERFKVRQMIHGHTHRQNIHQIPPHFKRIVLGDWHDDYASILEVSEQETYFLPQTAR